MKTMKSYHILLLIILGISFFIRVYDLSVCPMDSGAMRPPMVLTHIVF